jgi:hypothetical protein
MKDSPPHAKLLAFTKKMEGNDLFASMIAMHVRNAIEDMHADRAIGLTDDVMAELNKLTRRAILSR